MKQSIANPPCVDGHLLLSAFLLVCFGTVVADEPGQAIPDPGFRPPSALAAGFVDRSGSIDIAVLPTIVRREDRSAHSFESQQQIIAFLDESGIGSATSRRRRIDLGAVQPISQWDTFQRALDAIGAELSGYDTGSDYTLIMEILVPGGQAVFGIETYIVDQQGQNIFSFLLNSHHELFANAELVAVDTSEEARLAMLRRATQAGLVALEAQMEQVRKCIAEKAGSPPAKAKTGVLMDFQVPPESTLSPDGIALGLSTFSDGSSRVSIAASKTHPAMPTDADGNTVLQLELDVTGWAGFVSLFHDEEASRWTTQDWSEMDGFSFWLYSPNSGAKLFVDILDNRGLCSKRDDAERYTFEFTDDSAGWRLISVRFSDMQRKEIYNIAPNDGLTLTDVHGWGFGTLNTGGRRVFFIDDFSLWRD